MAFIIGIGTHDSWVGLTMDYEGSTGHINDETFAEPNFLWEMNYNYVRNILNDTKTSYPNSFDYKLPLNKVTLKVKSDEIKTDKNKPEWRRAYIYDKKGNLSILASNTYKQDEYDLVDTYKLNQKPPDWEKIQRLEGLMKEHRENLMNIKA